MPATSPSCGSTASSAPRSTLRTTTLSTRSRCSLSPTIRTRATSSLPRRAMSHHFDWPQDETLDVTDAYCFAGASDKHGPRTVIGVNTSPMYGKPWNPAGYYELKLDTNGDHVEDITYRATFPIGSDGKQYVQVAELTGAAARDRNAPGTIITPPNAPIGEVVELGRGIKLFAGKRRDTFY